MLALVVLAPVEHLPQVQELLAQSSAIPLWLILVRVVVDRAIAVVRISLVAMEDRASSHFVGLPLQNLLIQNQ